MNEMCMPNPSICVSEGLELLCSDESGVDTAILFHLTMHDFVCTIVGKYN